ncbi:MAG: MFS transporter, partial [Sedimenticolaceae bacterium]
MPYWRLSGFYFFYFALLGALVPYWGLFLRGRGFDAVAIGELMAILMATKIVAPNVWGWLGDHLGHRMRIVRVASAVS